MEQKFNREELIDRAHYFYPKAKTDADAVNAYAAGVFAQQKKTTDKVLLKKSGALYHYLTELGRELKKEELEKMSEVKCLH
jgi:hypothetical protein